MLSFRDPIHGFIRTDELETALIQSRPMQRLRFIRQLGWTFLIFPGAEHSRFSHVLGHDAPGGAGLRRVGRQAATGGSRPRPRLPASGGWCGRQRCSTTSATPPMSHYGGGSLR